MEHSSYFTQARALISSFRDHSNTEKDIPLQAVKLTALILQEAKLKETPHDRRLQNEMARLMDDPNGKVFTMSLTDQCFRTHNNHRVADQIFFLIDRYGIPLYLSFYKKLSLQIFRGMGKWMSALCIPWIKYLVHRESSRFILPGESQSLWKAINAKCREGIRLNLNHLGEAVLGENEAHRRLNTYLDDLRHPEVEYISVKISTICSQLNLLAWEDTLSILVERLKILLKAAHENFYQRLDGTSVPKFVNLDMEEYRDLHLTVALFKKVLEDPDCLQQSAGIVLQSYLPDSYLILQDLTGWAMQRVRRGCLPIKIRIVKGANLAMEKVDASLHGWPQAPFPTKLEVDANFKRMMNFACKKKHATAVHIGVGSHNLFDIAYVMLLRAKNNVENEVNFEMLEGMADSLRRVVQVLAGEMLLYCPAATKKDFQNAVAYLVRRLDENTQQENFLRHAFNLRVGSIEWNHQEQQFLAACKEIDNISLEPRRTQNRLTNAESKHSFKFENDSETDWSLPVNRLWAEKLSEPFDELIKIPGKGTKETLGYNPSNPSQPLYSYHLLEDADLEEVVSNAVQSQKEWENVPINKRSLLLAEVAQQIRDHRGDLIRAMIADTAKTVQEADLEISEAIDFLEYYRHSVEEIHHFEDIRWKSKGPVLVTPPWNFPCSIPVGGISAALCTGNVVIFKPAPEAVLVGWVLVQLFWKAGITKDLLQFINCEDEPYGSKLIRDKRIAVVVLTGATDTAKHFLKLNPSLDLIAETGGKNAIIVSDLADRDQAVKDIIQSAFGYAGQKCSACSLVVCLNEIYQDPQFLQQLKDAAASLKVGSPWNLSTRLNPLIRPAGETLTRGLTHLDKEEAWLLEPKQDAKNPNLWSPGIKLNVKPGSFMHQEELFGPVIGLICAKNLDEAIHIVNQTRYGLTSGLQSLDLREQYYWADRIQAGNCYINRGITGAIVQRQPFGGWKESCYSPGAKAGGPNYIMQFMHAHQIDLPFHAEPLSPKVAVLEQYLEKSSQHDKKLWKASAENYAFYWAHYFSMKHDNSLIMGEDNFLRYIPRKKMILRLNHEDKQIDVLRVVAAAMTCGAEITISTNVAQFEHPSSCVESEEELLSRIQKYSIKRVRFLSPPSENMRKKLVDNGCYITVAPVLANGRIELLKYLREQSLTISYHRYGNLGERGLM